MRMFAIGAVLLLSAAGGGLHAQPAGPPAALDFSALIAAVRIPGPLDFCGEPVPLALPDVRERLEREMLQALANPDQVILWIKRGPAHLVPIEAALARRRMPDDLKYVAIAESALRPHAGSPKGAMGFWQFIEPTGKRYGLRVDGERDERRSLDASTEAALAYLQDLRAMFGSWTLAAAAYNMGEYGLQNEIREQEIADYYQLHLPLETQRYIFRILSAKLILQDPRKYGFHLEPGDIYPAIEAERLTVRLDKELHLLAAARAAGTTVKALKDLNPDIRGYRLAAGTHTLWVPRGAAPGFTERLAQHASRMEAERREIVVVVKEGETLSQIAQRHGVGVADLRAWNGLDAKKPIQPGMRLTVRTRNPPAPERGEP